MFEDILLHRNNCDCYIRATIWMDLSEGYSREGNLTAREAALEKAAQLQDQLGSYDSRTRAYFALTLGTLFSAQGQHVKAEVMLQQSLTAALEISKANEEVAHALSMLGFDYMEQGKYD